MRPVHQDQFLVEDDDGENVQRGNCLQAALATVFDLPLDEVPHFVAMPADVWWSALERWLAERNIAVNWLPQPPWYPLGAYYLMTGKSPRGDFKHVVVCRNGDLIHDPHPDGTGLDMDHPEQFGIYYFVVLDPARQPVTAGSTVSS